MYLTNHTLLNKDLFLENHITNNCGVFTKNYILNEKFGHGNLITHSFDGLHIEFLTATLHDSYVLKNVNSSNTFDLSILLKGEKIISCKSINKEITQESQETLMYFTKNDEECIKYYKNIPVKEIRVKMFYEFIKKHQLTTLFPLLKKCSEINSVYSYTAAFCSKTQEIITDLLTNTRKGILKRLFLESKVLELISLQVEQQNKLNSPEHLVKKLYKVRNIISANLNEHFSIKKLSKEVLLNDTILKKEFKRVFNTTISEYSTSLRMTKARELLTHTDKPIYEVSDIVGYKNPTHFSAAFKKHESLTPKQFRGKYAV